MFEGFITSLPINSLNSPPPQFRVQCLQGSLCFQASLFKMTADCLERLITPGLLSGDKEREACDALEPDSGYVRHPPTPHMLNTFITPDDQLFQTIHMGAAVVNESRYIIKVDGLVERPFSLSMGQLKQFPSTTVTAFHECYGPPLKAPKENYWRIGNIKWTGARLKTVLDLAQPLPEAQFVWSEGLDYG